MLVTDCPSREFYICFIDLYFRVQLIRGFKTFKFYTQNNYVKKKVPDTYNNGLIKSKNNYKHIFKRCYVDI